MKVDKHIIAEIDALVATLTNESGKTYKKSKKFLKEMIAGIIGKGSVLLSDVSRYLKEETMLKHREKRLSYQLNNKHWESEATAGNYLEYAKGWIKEESVITLDMGDISKDYGRKMPKIGNVWDGSKKEVRKGWWMIEMVCHRNNRQTMPLLNYVFHTESHRYRSHNRQIKKIVEWFVSIAGNRGIWALDRGFDDVKMFLLLLLHRIQFVVRLRSTRSLIPLHIPNLKRRSLAQIARLVRKGNEPISFVPVQIPETAVKGTLVIQHGATPWYLFTSMNIENLAQAQKVISYYGRRWSVEDSGRVFKNIFNVENIRSRTFKALQRLVHIATWAHAVLFRISLLPKKIVTALLQLEQVFTETKKIIYYRLAKALKQCAIQPCRLCNNST